MGVETEYGLIAAPPPRQRQLAPDELARVLFSPVVREYSSSNIFLDNASRLYLDVGSHPEVATAECDSLSQLLAYERAGDEVVDELAQTAEHALPGSRVYLFKNNVDSAGNSYGCHENYLVGRNIVLRELGRAILPFLITRQLICGAGMIAPAKGDQPAQFLLSQRADQVWESVSSATTRSRPIINTRDEPHGDSKRFRRMHVIIGDSNMAEPSFALKVGSMLLMVEMIEAGFDLPDLEIDEPIVQLRRIARDETGRVELPLSRGGTTTPLAVQTALYECAGKWLDSRPEKGTSNAELRRVHQLWGDVLAAIDSGDFSKVNRDVDWVIKKQLLERYRDRLGGDWAHPKLAQIDLTYHDIRVGRGVYDHLVQRGLVNRWIDDIDIARAKRMAPATTRAAMRGRFLAQARASNANITVDWTRMKVNRPEPHTEEFLDPFETNDNRLEALIDYMVNNADTPPE
ncbi:Pup--protein ligase [Corynebacterium phocae]|uniref:Pup--protein ligase n=1 Tax=Corynebacterium phocae TaxID=161895 RepID=A0A1L7D6B6_9CORY|nr:Pup--protein ligase [Corynebacterium phocae]APT93706.1 Pup--protein ligase [Corynebacterium phocae]KAA8725208.1 Pup--protein ligase [Corynebacterium phocae]